MTNLEWLLSGDPVIERLTRKRLLEENVLFHQQGFIENYLSRYDTKTKTWGNGFYGPKWVSTNYTLLDLKDMEIDPKHPVYQESLIHYLNHYFVKYIEKHGMTTMDLCISGMFIGLLSYGGIHDSRLNQLIDYVLSYRMPDGAWNCLWNHPSKPKIGSVHTTINVLEGLLAYDLGGYPYRNEDVKSAIEHAISALLNRQLVFKMNQEEAIHPDLLKHHYPPRWKYDYLRVLVFLARKKHPYHPKMEPALQLLIHHLKKGRLSKGTTLSGRIHFPLESSYEGRFNTLRAYEVLKVYRPERYQACLNQSGDDSPNLSNK